LFVDCFLNMQAHRSRAADDEGGWARERRQGRTPEARHLGCGRCGARGALRAAACCVVSLSLLAACHGSPTGAAPTLGNLQPGLSGVGGVEGGVQGAGGTPVSGLPIPQEMPPTPNAPMEVTVPGHYSNFKEAIDKCDPVGELGTIVVHPGEHRWENFLEIGQTLSIRGVSSAVLPVTRPGEWQMLIWHRARARARARV